MILASHLPGEAVFQSERFEVTSIICIDPLDYWRGIEAHWGLNEPLVLVEHDMEASDELIARLLDDPHPLATFAYPLYWISTGRAQPQYAQRVGEFLPDRKYLGRPVRENAEWADFTGIGLCKISPEAHCAALQECSWQHLDMAVNAAVDGRWRVLWPEVEHFHV